MVQHLRHAVFSLSLLLSILVLPGCALLDWFQRFGAPAAPTEKPEQKPVDTSEVLLTMDTTVDGKIKTGVSVITQQSFEEYKAQLEQDQPGLSNMLSMMPQFERQLFDDYKNGLILREWVKREKINLRPDYKKAHEKYLEMIERLLAAQFFEQDVAATIKITDEQAEKYYKENKTTDPAFQRPPFRKTAGGVSALGVSFKTEKEANEFLTKAKAAGANFSQAAKTAGKTVRDFGTVNMESDVNPAIVTQLTGLKDIPSTTMVKANGEYWVIRALKKIEAEYAPLADVKDKVKEIMSRKELGEAAQKRFSAIEEQYNAKVNNEYFAKKAQPAEKEAAEDKEAEDAEKEMPAPTPGPAQAA